MTDPVDANARPIAPSTPARASARTSGGNVTDIEAARQRRRRNPANRRFDALKVARLKEEIRRGEYAIDHYSVADRFIEHERNAH